MDVRAIILIGNPAATPSISSPGTKRYQHGPGAISGVPMPLLPLLGRSLAARVTESLINAGVDKVSILSSAGPLPAADEQTEGIQAYSKNVNAENIWRTAEEEFCEFAQNGAELILVLHLGAYAEIDLDRLLQFHLDQRSRVTQVFDSQGPLEIFVISASRRNDAAHLFRTCLTKSRVPVREYYFEGYVNRLQTAEDFRRLAADSFALKTSIRPAGEEVRPGIWKGTHAKIDRGARIVAPAYIGAYSQVRSSALITRGSSIEHHCVVDCGTAIDNSTVLPFSYIGVGLDLCNSILGFQQITHLKRNAVVAIEDPRLARAISQTATMRVLKHAAELCAYLPRQIWRSLRGEQLSRPTTVAETTNIEMQHFDPPVVGECSSANTKVFDSDLAVVRRYGNQ